METCYFYILYSKAFDRFYYGHTCECLDERLIRHLQRHRGFTSKQNDWQVVYHESYSTKKEAFAREREVKGWKSRSIVLALIGKA